MRHLNLKYIWKLSKPNKLLMFLPKNKYLLKVINDPLSIIK